LTEDGLRIFCLLLAVLLLLGASVLTASLAEEPAAGDSKAAGSPTESGAVPSAGENAGAGAAKVDSRQHEQGKGDDAKTPGVDGLGPGHQTDEAIDTRMPSRHVDGGRDKIGRTKARARLLQPWRRATPGKFDQGLRNAIGVPLARRESLERRRAERQGAPSVMPDRAVADTTTTAAGHVERPSVLRAATGPSTSPTILNRGAINGTSAMPRGAGSHSIGGPTRAVAGISGTAIRPKH
jgi:hypothetical protein